jgi:hypothetical protein
MNRIETIDLQGKAYAQVKDRVKQFRTENPNGLIETNPTIQPDGTILFKARILKDKADPNSAEASGYSYGKVGGKAKDFEKLETISVGRALAFLGYAADGEIASSEEMEEFQEYKQQQFEEAVMEAVEAITNATSLEQLKEIWSPLPIEIKSKLTEVKEQHKARLTTQAQTNENETVPGQGIMAPRTEGQDHRVTTQGHRSKARVG